MFLNINNSIKNDINIHKVTLIILYVTILSLAWNLFKIWRISMAYINGHLVDYLAPKLYLNQLLVWFLWGWTLVTARGQGLTAVNFRQMIFGHKFSFLLFLLLFVLPLVKQDVFLFLWITNFISGPLLLFIWLRFFAKKLLGKTYRLQLHQILIFSSTFQALIGLSQFALQKSQTPYLFFGEPLFAPHHGLAVSSLSPTQLFLPYGTTPHPNILAAWIITGMLATIIYWYIDKKKNAFLIISFFLQSLVLWLTESWTAWLSFFLLIWITWFISKKKHTRFGFSSFKKSLLALIFIAQVAWLSLPIWLPQIAKPLPLEETSISRRIQLEEVTLQALRKNYFGVQLDTYFQTVYQAESSFIGTRFLQPVHNSPLFLVIVLGYCTILLIIIFIAREHKYYPLFFILLLALSPFFNLDHYLLSLISGQYILVLLLIYFSFLTNE